MVIRVGKLCTFPSAGNGDVELYPLEAITSCRSGIVGFYVPGREPIGGLRLLCQKQYLLPRLKRTVNA